MSDRVQNSLSHTLTASSSSSSNSTRPFESIEPISQNTTKSSHRLSAKLLRSKSPIPIDIPDRREPNTSDPLHQTMSRSYPSASTSADMPRRSASPVRSPQSPTSPRHSRNQRDSRSHHSRRSSDDYRRYRGTVNHYGRHSNDWLFGGFSLRDTVRDGVERLRHHGRHDEKES